MADKIVDKCPKCLSNVWKVRKKFKNPALAVGLFLVFLPLFFPLSFFFLVVCKKVEIAKCRKCGWSTPLQESTSGYRYISGGAQGVIVDPGQPGPNPFSSFGPHQH